MKARGYLMILGLAFLLLIGFVIFRLEKQPTRTALHVTTVLRRGTWGPNPQLVRAKLSKGFAVSTNEYSVVWVEITNGSSTCFKLFSNDGGSVWCEYHDRTASGWTNWTPPLDAIHDSMLLKPHSRLPVGIKLREDGGDREFRIICEPQPSSPRVPGVIGRIETRLYGLLPRRLLRLPVPPFNNSAAQISGPVERPSVTSEGRRAPFAGAPIGAAQNTLNLEIRGDLRRIPTGTQVSDGSAEQFHFTIWFKKHAWMIEITPEPEHNSVSGYKSIKVAWDGDALYELGVFNTNYDRLKPLCLRLESIASALERKDVSENNRKALLKQKSSFERALEIQKEGSLAKSVNKAIANVSASELPKMHKSDCSFILWLAYCSAHYLDTSEDSSAPRFGLMFGAVN